MKKVLAVFSHPDDAEFLCAGTLALLKKAGWEIFIATLTAGDKGTKEYSSDEICRIRQSEASRSAAIIGGEYICLDFEDLFIFYNRNAIEKVSSLVRQVKPDIVLTSSPSDYIVDHEITAKLVQTSCFACGIQNLQVLEEIFHPIPHLYYADPFEGKDKFGTIVSPSFYTEITSEMNIKRLMLQCHESQRNWLFYHHKIDEYILSMERHSRMRGSEIGVEFAEAFRQHLGHGFPSNNLLKEVIDDAKSKKIF